MRYKPNEFKFSSSTRASLSVCLVCRLERSLPTACLCLGLSSCCHKRRKALLIRKEPHDSVVRIFVAGLLQSKNSLLRRHSHAAQLCYCSWVCATFATATCRPTSAWQWVIQVRILHVAKEPVCCSPSTSIVCGQGSSFSCIFTETHPNDGLHYRSI